MLRLIGLLITGVMSLCAVAFTGLCLYVGNSAHWTGDGPGMLFVMMGVFVGAVACLVCGGMFLSTLAGSSESEPPK